MALAAAGLNFNGFTEVHDLISHRTMMAYGNVDEGELCEVLQEMDRIEYQVLQAEDIEIKKITGLVQKTSTNSLIPFAVAGCGFGAVLYDSANRDNDNVLKSVIIMIAGLSIGFIAGALGVGMNLSAQDNLTKVIEDLYDKRVLRLQAKARALESEISSLEDGLVEKEQMSKARDFFDLKRTFYVAQKVNTIKITK